MTVAGPLLPRRGILIHASAAVLDGKALIFLGPSETGKSTICRRLGAYAQPFADDKVCLFRGAGGRWTITNRDDTWAGGKLFDLVDEGEPGVLLRAVLRLYRGRRAYLEPVGALQLCRLLTDALFEINWPDRGDVAARWHAFAGLAAVARSTPGYVYYFNRSVRAIDVLREKIGLWS
jgi:hypothetical protein